MTNVITIKVRGYHVDAYRHVNNARYLEFLEEGRWALFEESPSSSGWPEEAAFVVVNININYRKGASIGDILEIRTKISHLGPRSGMLRQEIILQGTQSVVVDAEVTFAMVDRRTQKALPLAGQLFDFFDRLRDAEGEPFLV